MKFLIDECLSLDLVEVARGRGFVESYRGRVARPSDTRKNLPRCDPGRPPLHCNWRRLDAELANSIQGTTSFYPST
jgi:hypothetical protein